ncbi:MAG: glutamate-cysteine ligase family protein [Candidatus Thorarchaeota archaeon]
MIAISYESLPKDSPVILVSTGLNPTQDYLKNLSFGEHHHILSPASDEHERIAIYNMIRNFIPHLIALTVNSPFENKKPTDEVRIDEKGNIRAPRCRRSIRLLKNTTQMGPTNEFEMIPYLTRADKEDFARHVNRSYARMVDMYPFTDYGTIEVRVFDTQLSVPRRVGLALLLQALALRAKRMLEGGNIIPDVSASTLASNRESAVSAGLWGPFRSGKSEENLEFISAYNHTIDDEGRVNGSKKNRFMGDAVVSMLFLIREELEELNAMDNPFLQPLLVSVFGSEYVEPRTTGADFQLAVYAKSDMNMVVLLKRLTDITRECCTNWLFDPLEGTPHLPTWLAWWKGIEPEIITERERVFAGQTAEFVIKLRNATKRILTNLTVTYVIEDSKRNVIEQNVLTITNIDAGEIHVSRVNFQTQRDISAYNIIATIGIAGGEINLQGTISTYWMTARIRPGTTTQFADGTTPVHYSGEIETNYPQSSTLNCNIAVLAPRKVRILSEVSKSLTVEGGETLVFDQLSMPELVIPAESSDGVERCILRVSLTDADGQEISIGTSKPFYAGFVQRGPQLLLRTDHKSSHSPGEIIHGELDIKARGYGIGENTVVQVSFCADSGSELEITKSRASNLLAESLVFQWRVPQIGSDIPSERTGVIKARIIEGSNEISQTESSRLKIEHLGIQISIDSLRAPVRSQVGGKISGWMRVRRNTEVGEPALLTMILQYSDNEEHIVLKQSVKQVRNLSLSYGPIEIPKPSKLVNPKAVTLIARLTYTGIELDQRTAVIDLVEDPREAPILVSFSGVPSYTAPDDEVHAAIHVTNVSAEKMEVNLQVELESVAGNSILNNKVIELNPEETKIIPVSVRAPLNAEMSTAHLKALVSGNEISVERRLRFKIKAIEEPYFKASFSIRNEAGEEVPGLVPRVTPVTIGITLESKREDVDNLTILLGIMSRKTLIKQFEIPCEEFVDGKCEISVGWTTPAVDMVTGFYLYATLLQAGRALPSRAVEQTRKRFTIY